MDSLKTILLYVLLVFAGVLAVNGIVHLVWRVRSRLKRRNEQAPEEILRGDPSIWKDPGNIESLDLYYGRGGRDGTPAPPFRFIEEHDSGSSPNLSIRDDCGRVWRVKWGVEVNTECFCTRIAWACGYFVETTYFVPEGRIEGAKDLVRAQKCIDEQSRFHDARFELDEKSVNKLFEEKSWDWNENPFVGTHELNGLKILSMLFSNWDNKDVKDVARGSNTAIFEYKLPDSSIESRYLVIDWGGAMGKWGTNIISRKIWDCESYEAQNSDFVKVKEDGMLDWGFLGQRTENSSTGITIEDVRWLHRYLGRISNQQIHDALLASGATAEQADCFTRAIRDRISRLQSL